MEQGFIILQRKIIENWLWLSEPFSKAQAWIDLLLLANHTNGSFFIRGVKVDIKRGQIGKSEESLRQRWKWSRGKVRSFLKLLETEQQIKHHKSPILNVIEIINYDFYQKPNNRLNSKKTAERQQKDTNNKEEIIIKEEEINIPDFIDKDLLNDFFAFRESIATKKKPFTERAKQLIVKDLIKFEAIKKGFANLSLENAIKNSWQGVFEPKDNGFNSTAPTQEKPTNSLASEINEMIGKDLIKDLIDKEDLVVHFHSAASFDEWSKVDEKIKNEIREKLSAKYKKNIKTKY